MNCFTRSSQAMTTSSIGVDKELEDLLLYNLFFFLALTTLKEWAGTVDGEAKVEASLTLIRLEVSGFFLETTFHDEAPGSKLSLPYEDV